MPRIITPNPLMRTMQRSSYLTTAVLVTLTAAGCGSGLDADYSKIGLVPVSGTVTLDGEPLAGAVVFFEARDLTRSYATTDAAGRYQMQFNSEVTGVPPGPKTVRISTAASTGEDADEASEELEEDPDARPTADQAVEKVPPCYHRNSTLQVTIDDSRTQYDFDLRSDCSTSGPM